MTDEEFWNRKLDAPRATEPAASRPRAPFAPARASLVDRVLDRMRDWRSDPRLGLVALVLLAVIAGVVWYRIGIGSDDAGAKARATRPAPAVRTTSPTPRDSSPGTTPPARDKARIAVHVAGAVAHPGVVELAAGSRVIDAVEAVGGAPPDADLDRLNLAAKIADGQRIFVPKVGQADPGAAAGGAAGSSSNDPGTGATVDGKLNLNTATQAQLEELPGIGPTFAQAIIAERERRGGFKSINELRSVRGIGDKRFAELAPLVSV